MRYEITAEHTQGRSVSHPCTNGVYDDPTDEFSVVVDAESEDEAVGVGWDALDKIVRASQPCDCKRHLQAGGEQWTESVCLTATKL